MVQREILAIFEGNQKGAISLKPNRPCSPKLVCMHWKSTSSCMNFLSRFPFDSIFDLYMYYNNTELHYTHKQEYMYIMGQRGSITHFDNFTSLSINCE